MPAMAKSVKRATKAGTEREPFVEGPLRPASKPGVKSAVASAAGNLAVQRAAVAHGRPEIYTPIASNPGIALVENAGPAGIAVEDVGPNMSKVRFLGVVIATVRYFEKSERKITATVRQIAGEPGKPPRVQILLECYPYVRIRLNRAGIRQLTARGFGLDVGVKQVGIEIKGGVETGYPILPPQESEVVRADPPTAEKAPEGLPPSETEEPEVTVPEESTTSIFLDILERIRTGLERAAVKALLNEAARRMAKGEECQSFLDKAAEIAVGILERKTAAFDPRSAKKEVTQELMNATADVMFLGTGEEAAESAMNKAVVWAQVQLDRAVERWRANPTKANAIEVANKAVTVMLYGGDETEAMELLMKYFPPPGSKVVAPGQEGGP